MLSASLVTRWRAPCVKGLRAALVLAKAARFAVLDKAGTKRPPLTPRPTGLNASQLRKHVVFYGDTRPALRAGRPRKHTPEESR